MGSGSSKPKSSANAKANRPDKVSKVQAGKKSVNSDLINTEQKKAPSQNVIEVERVKNDRNLERTSIRQPEKVPEVKPSSNGNVTKSQAKAKPDKFESDSESEAEDISAVLEATRAAEQNSYRAKQNAQANKPTEYFPETYAQRLQREQYAKTQQGLFRQKTIYRNPDEWEVDEVGTQSSLPLACLTLSYSFICKAGVFLVKITSERVLCHSVIKLGFLF